ncbi:MAG: hypothetical protein ACK40X_00710 [Armatimonadota bacterium]
MMLRKWALILIFATTSNLHSQEIVFVDLKQLASFHPAWQLADSIERRTKPTLLSLPLPPLHFSDVPLSPPTLQISQLTNWLEEQRRRWESELESLQRGQQKILNWQMYLLLPPLPLLDPVARWKFIVQEREKQAAERLRLSLRLSFADMLSPEEKTALEQRKRELDAALEPPPVVTQPIFMPISPAEKLDLTLPSPLTDPQKILDLVAPLFLPPQQISEAQVPEISDAGLKLLSDSAIATLRAIAFEGAKNFALTYAKQKGWKVTFSPRSGLRDVTDEVKRAWQQWLKSIQPKE